MLKKSLIFVIFLLVAVFTVTIPAAELTAADKPGGKKTASRINLGSVPKIALSGAQNPVGRIPGDEMEATKSLGFDESSSNSPGLTVGLTTYDNQSYSRMNRQVDWRATETVHFTWTKQTITAPLGDCGTTYEAWDYDDAVWWWGHHEYGGCDIHIRLGYGINYSAYTGLDVDTEGKVIIANHHDRAEGFATTVWYDFLEGSCYFAVYRRRIPDTTMQYGVSPEYIQSGEWRFLWPSMEYQVLDGDTVTHVFAYQNRNDDKSSFVHYFRRIGSDTLGWWEYPPMLVDTIPTISQIVTSSRTTGKVALVWQAPPGQFPGDPESLSRDWFDPGLGSNQRTNEVFYMISYDMGASWYEKHNVTVFDPSQGGWLGQGDMSALIASDDNLHIVWNAREVVPAPMGLGQFTHFYGSRLFHWDEYTNEIRVIKDANWDLPDNSACHGGAWNEMSIVKPQISECDGKFYTIFVQFNDIDNGIYNDCHENAFSALEGSGTANGELYISVSENAGYNWDVPRNLTNSYTPHCDTSAIPYECDSDMWPSISRFGMEVTIGDFTGVPVVDPSGAYSGNYFLDVFYVNDKYPGSCLDNARVWTTNELKWFRVPCIEPEPNAVLSVTPREIGDPTWTKPGVELDTTIRLENIGNAHLYINAINIIEIDYYGWLGIGSYPYDVSHLSPNYYDLTVYLNQGGNIQSGPVAVDGYLEIYSNSLGGSRDTIEVHLIVADSLQFPETADIRTECTRIVFNNAGNIGNKGNYHVGNYNLDFFDDCDTSQNQMGEDDNASIYLYEASPFILRINGTGDTILNYYMYDADWLSDDGFRPTEGMYVDSTTYPDYQYTHTGWFLTKDSAVKLNSQYFAPKHPDSCKFIVQRLTVTGNSGGALYDIYVGNIMDWDIPSDSGVRNGSGFDAAGGEGSRDLMYCYGGEYAPDSIENNDCVLADQRVAGVAFYNGYRIPYCFPADSLENPAGPWWTHINHDWVDPTGGFIPGQLYKKIEYQGGGFESWESPDPDSIAEDLHMVAVFGQFDLGQTDTLVFVNILATEYDGGVPGIQQTVDKARAWIANRPEISTWPEPIPLGRCCYGDSTSPDCDDLIVEECAALGDALSWRGDLNCTSNPCSAQIGSPVGYWKFDEGAGNLAHDSSGFGNTGTLINGPTWVDGIVGKALSFDGVNDYVEIPDAPALDIGGSFTITAWILPRSFNQYYNFLVAKRDNYVLACENSGDRLSIGFTNTAGSGHVLHSGSGTLNLNQWQHIAAVWDGHSLKLFKNGAEIKSGSYGSYHGFPLTSNDPLNIGTSVSGTYRFDGIMDEVKIYARAITAEELRVERDMLLVGYWKFDENTGSIAYDSSGNSNDGILTNGPTWESGVLGNSVGLDGVDDYVNCSDDPSLDIVGELSFAGWVKFDVIPNDFAAFVSKNEGWGANNKWAFGYAHNYAGITNALAFHINDPSDPQVWLKSPQWTPTAGKWYHVAVIKNRNIYTFYANGAKLGEDSTQTPLPSVSAPLLIGRSEGSFHLAGNVDEAKIYGCALVADEVLNEFAQGQCGDANGDGNINILDITFLINYLYKGGPAPDPMEIADANGSGNINLLDITYLIGYLYKGGPGPNCLQ